VLSSSIDKRLGRSVGNDLFYTPENALFERQAEHNVDESDEYSFTANTTYSRRNGDILNLNTLYSKEDEKERRLSERFQIAADEESFERDVLIVGEDATLEWEIGGDYEHVLANGNVLTGLFVVTSRDGDEESTFELTPVGEVRAVDELQREDWHRSERILRGTYAWGASERGSWESGAEVALNAVDRSIQLFEDVDGDGALQETLLFNQASEVEETRIEAFTSYSWQAGEDLLIESSLDLEASELTQTGGDVDRSRDFFFARPRVALRYDLTGQTQLRARVERSVSQLDFGAFTASFLNDDNRLDVISAGNPELEPEKSWDYELTYERRLANDVGFVSVTGTFRDIDDLLARIPLLVRAPNGDIEERTAPGNIGDGTEIELEVNASVRLGWLRLDNAVLESTVTVTETDVTDPFTGEDREHDSASPYEWRLRFRHDTSWKSVAYGFEVGKRGPDERFDLDYREVGERDAELELFAELSPLDNLTLRLEFEEVLRAESQRERHQYVGNRGDGILARRELRLFKPVRELTLSVEGTF
jgi:outer membrane receptor for ferrienterochelin and colicins